MFGLDNAQVILSSITRLVSFFLCGKSNSYFFGKISISNNCASVGPHWLWYYL